MEDEEVVIVPYKDGPYVIRGPVVLQDQDGAAIKLNRRTIALCRCGKSRMRPFCDGTHQVIRFRAASSAEPGPGAQPAAGDGPQPSDN
jgi:CDGSH-type Zn-finger protein